MTGKRFVALVATDLSLMTLILWVLFANSAAEVVFKAYIWVIVPLSFVAYLISPAQLCEWPRSGRWFIGYSRGVRIVEVAFLAVAHETAMLAVRIVAWVVFEAVYRWCIEQNNKEAARET